MANGVSGPPSKAEIREQCRTIRHLLSIGQTESEIRDRLSLNKQAWRQRLKAIGSMNLEPLSAWVGYKSAMLVALEELAKDRHALREKGANAEAAKCTRAMVSLQNEMIATGQSLGMYVKAPDKMEVETISLGMFHDQIEEVMPLVRPEKERGN